MSMQTRRSSSSSLAKKNTTAVSVGDALTTKKMPAAGTTNLGRKRAPLGDITNNRSRIHATAHKGSKTALTLEQNSTKTAKLKRGPPPEIAACKVTPVPSKEDAVVSSKSDGVSTSIDKSMSTCNSYQSAEAESIEKKKTLNRLYISDEEEVTVENHVCSRNALGVVDMDTDEKIVNIDADVDNPQLCATNACDIYKHLRASETKKRPASYFMERTPKDINASMRAILIDWLVEVQFQNRLYQS